MISVEHEAIFIHLRRTGGNSIEMALGGIQLFDREGRPTQQWDNRIHRGSSRHKKNTRGHWIHDGALAVRRRYPRKFERYFKFSMVRNPWAQMVSLHLRLHRYLTGPWRFRHWLYRYAELEGTVPALSLHDENGALLMDYVGRFERLHEDFAHVCERIGMPAHSLPHANSSKSLDYTAFYDAAAKKYVADLFAEDIERYGYRFGD